MASAVGLSQTCVGESAVVVLPSIHRVALLGAGSRLRVAGPGGSSRGAEPMTELYRAEVGERGAVRSRTKVERGSYQVY